MWRSRGGSTASTSPTPGSASPRRSGCGSSRSSTASATSPTTPRERPATCPRGRGLASPSSRGSWTPTVTPDGGRIEISGHAVGRNELLGRREFLRCFYREFPENVEKSGGFYRLDVADTGVGIPEEERVRIFEKFYGIGDIAYHSSGKTGYMSKGSGLGLSIVKGIMDAHGGMVWVEPGAGGTGSVFSLIFPTE
ncbi:sensor histidine kinase [Geobacter pickeringii]|uniref:sensor histidine kinase n=1 Tax=Geobacter pickeringii TaxID=345632 RepID=UPI0038B379E5